MVKIIPKHLEFVKKSLYSGEEELWLSWYNNLANPDKKNMANVLKKSHDWITKQSPDYFIVGAIGSALTGKQYNDVDLLVITNRIWGDMGSFEGVLLEEILSKDFKHTITPNMLEAYDKAWARPNRTLVTLKPIIGDGKSIHITVQPEIYSERDWRLKDKDPCTVLYRKGDTSGHYEII